MAAIPNHLTTEVQDLRFAPGVPVDHEFADGGILLSDEPGSGIRIDEAAIDEAAAADGWRDPAGPHMRPAARRASGRARRRRAIGGIDGDPTRTAPHPGPAGRAVRRALSARRETDAALLVDTGIRESITETFLPYLDAHGIPREKVRWAVNTHCDFDHTGGNGALKAAIPSVRILAHADDQPLVEDVQRLIDERYGEFRDSDGFDDPPETTAYLRARDRSRAPGRRRCAAARSSTSAGGRSRVLHVPGHSPGHVAVHDPANRALADRRRDARAHGAVRRRPRRPSRRRIGTSSPTSTASAAFRALDADLLLTAHYPVYEGPGSRRSSTSPRSTSR